MSFGLILPIVTWAQSSSINGQITNKDGIPIAKAKIMAREGALLVETDENGNFTIETSTDDALLIEAEGYNSKKIAVSEVVNNPAITLESLPFHMTEADLVNVPFGQFTKRRLTGGVTVIEPDDILLYDNEQTFNGVLNGRVPGLINNSNIRGLGNALIVVDGIPRPASSLNLQEIDQITVLRGLSARMLYGAQANEGVILVKTKRGMAFKRTMTVTAETGMQDPISFPNFLNAADYMELYNEALANDGEDPLYSSDQINNTRSGSDPVLYPNQEYYNSTFLNEMSTFNKVIAEASGGNEAAQYYVNVGWNRVSSLLNLGEGADEKTDRFNLRGNVDYQLNDWLRMSLDGIALIDLNRGPRYSNFDGNNNTNDDFWTLSASQLPNSFPFLIPANRLQDESINPVLIGGNSVLGGTSEFQNHNAYGELTRNGFTSQTNRVVQINTGLDFDLGGIAEGLTAKTFLSFDFINSFVRQQTNAYAVYQPIASVDSTGASMVTFNQIGIDDKQNTQNIPNGDIGFERRLGLYGVLDYDRKFGNNALKLTGLVYADQFEEIGVIQPSRNLHYGLRGNYTIDNKYIVEATGVYAGSSFLTGSNRFAFSPSIGLGWVMSEESFLQDKSWIDYFKLTGSFGLLNVNPDTDNFLYRTSYERDGNFQYNDGINQNTRLRIITGNEDIDWVKRQEFNIGFEGSFGDFLWIEANYFNSKSLDEVTQLTETYPGAIGGEDFTPFENFESFGTQGIELGLNIFNQKGDFRYNLGANLVYAVPKALTVNESEGLPDYRKQEGKETDAIFAYVADGFYQDAADIENSPVATFGEVKPGDIKYRDLNGDGIINQDDQEVIGNADPRLQLGFNLRLGYKNFELFAQGIAQAGEENFYTNAYYWVFGNRKYSDEVLGRWTPSTAASATYPRLSSGNNPNNFRNSSFWLYKEDFFSLRRLQLSYRLPFLIKGVRSVNVYARATNLLMISDNRERKQLNIAQAPQNRVYAFGLFASF